MSASIHQAEAKLQHDENTDQNARPKKEKEKNRQPDKAFWEEASKVAHYITDGEACVVLVGQQNGQGNMRRTSFSDTDIGANLSVS